MGISFLILVPVYAGLKPFDVFAIVFFILKINQKFVFYKIDYLFFGFIGFSFISSLTASYETTFDSLLQTLRYFFYFIIARKFTLYADIVLMVKGLKIGAALILIYIIFDIFYYYGFGCVSFLSDFFGESDKYSFTHRSVLLPPINGCLYYRPAGLSWDPGGFYPIILILATTLYGRTMLLKLSVIMAIAAISRTAIVAYVASKLFSFSKAGGSLLLVISVLMISAFFFFNQYLLYEEGNLRHATYPFLSVGNLVLDPTIWLFGTGLRGGAEFIVKNYDYSFIEVLNHGETTLVIESTFFNILMGSGVLGFMCYFIWVYKCFDKFKAAFIFFIAASLFYTFDTSALLFFIPFIYQIVKIYEGRIQI